tara:strand:+ start:503 stop:925 length:423 start_codon:yes stop_codon:yes gene_type:complete
MTSIEIQRATTENVRSRGVYGDDDEYELFPRLVLKLIEEAMELVECCEEILPRRFTVPCSLVGRMARRFLKRKYSRQLIWWTSARSKKIVSELADVQVVVFGIAEDLEKISGLYIDISEYAYLKSRSDLERRRGHEHRKV